MLLLPAAAEVVAALPEPSKEPNPVLAAVAELPPELVEEEELMLTRVGF